MKRFTLFGQDYSEVSFPRDCTEEDREEIKKLLWSKRFSKSAFCNLQTETDAQEKTPLLWEQAKAKGEYWWGGIVGSFYLESDDGRYGLSVTLTSRFDRDHQHSFLCRMIESWMALQGLPVETAVVAVQNQAVFRFLWVYIFKLYLHRAYQTGIYKAYQYFADNSSRLRGQIDVTRHIRLNMGMQNGSVAICCRENTTDNHVNHLIVHTYLELKRQMPQLVAAAIDADGKTGPMIRELMYQASSYSRYDVHTLLVKLRNPIAHPLFICYEELRVVCLRILSDTGVAVFPERDAADTESCGMMFYTPDLWERYVEHRILKPLGVSYHAQLRGEDFGSILNIRPDFVLYQKDAAGRERRIVLDAKMKTLWETYDLTKLYDHGSALTEVEQKAQKRLSEDIRQCLVYMQLLEAEFSGTIFPVLEGGSSHKIFGISRYDRHRALGGSFHTIGVYIPPAASKSNSDWLKQLREEEKKATQVIRQLLAAV